MIRLKRERHDEQTESALISSDDVDLPMKLFVALAMVLVVVGHITFNGFEGPFNMFPPYSFQVAAFVFVSGYFYNPLHENHVLRYSLKKIKRLLIPLYLIMLVYGLISTCLHISGFSYLPLMTIESALLGPLTSGHDYIINMPMWFIAPLFFAEIANIVFRRLLGMLVPGSKRGSIYELCVFILYLGAGSIAIRLGGADGLMPGWNLLFARTLFFLACFGMGRFYRAVLEDHDTLGDTSYFALVLAIQLALITACDGGLSYIPSWCQFPHGIFITYVATFTGIAFLLRLSKIFGNLIGNTKPIRLVADNTFSIMCHHYLGFFITSSVFGLIAASTPFLSSFQFEEFFNGLYFFFPHDQEAWSLLYCCVGLLFAVGIHRVWDYVKSQLGFIVFSRSDR